MITVISKHLPRSARFLGGKADERFLALIHIVEACRYHLHRFEILASSPNCSSIPRGFEPGIDIDDRQELFHLYNFMTSWFEIESFLLMAKRFLDQCWCLFGDSLGNGTEKIDTLTKAMSEKNLLQTLKTQDLVNKILEDSYYQELKKVWESWGQELVYMRNYAEHKISMGGLTFNELKISMLKGKQTFDIFLPDVIPTRYNTIGKRNFTFKKQRSLTQYMVDRMHDIDKLMEKLFPIDREHPLVK